MTLDLSENNQFAKKVINSWANAEWFTSKKPLEKEITVCIFKVNGEILIVLIACNCRTPCGIQPNQFQKKHFVSADIQF